MVCVSSPAVSRHGDNCRTAVLKELIKRFRVKSASFATRCGNGHA